MYRLTFLLLIVLAGYGCSRAKDYSCGGTAELRHWSPQRDEQIMQRDGYHGPRYLIQIDHYVPLCLGGEDDDDNLRVEFYPEARWKDIEEQRLCRAVCDRKMSRQEAIDTLIRHFPRR